MSKFKFPALRKSIRDLLKNVDHDSRVCPSCGHTIVSQKMIRHNCAKCQTTMIANNVSTVYNSYVNGKCRWMDD